VGDAILVIVGFRPAAPTDSRVGLGRIFGTAVEAVGYAVVVGVGVGKLASTLPRRGFERTGRAPGTVRAGKSRIALALHLPGHRPFDAHAVAVTIRLDRAVALARVLLDDDVLEVRDRHPHGLELVHRDGGDE